MGNWKREVREAEEAERDMRGMGEGESGGHFDLIYFYQFLSGRVISCLCPLSDMDPVGIDENMRWNGW